MRFCTGCATLTSVLVLVLALLAALVPRTTWFAGYDLQNCPNCTATIDWSIERSRAVSDAERNGFAEDGVVVLPGALLPDKVAALAAEVDNLSTTFMTDVLARTTLPHYLRYEHRLDTRSELVRDWAIHGPLGTWAAELLNATEVRLYNAEAIYHKGSDSPTPCSAVWHRDTIAAPFAPHHRAVTFNVYLDPISGDSDGLVYMRGSHKNLESPPSIQDDIALLYEPTLLQVGDVLAHDPNVYHTPSGRGCWKRRSLQFRYVAGTPPFSFGPQRFPHGPVPWTLAHAPHVAPHGLQPGDDLSGPWYPRVYPTPLEEQEHVSLVRSKNKSSSVAAWGRVAALLSVAQEAMDGAANIGIGGDDCHLPQQNPTKETGGDYGYYGFDGPVIRCTDWEMVNRVPCHKKGAMCEVLKKAGASPQPNNEAGASSNE